MTSFARVRSLPLLTALSGWPRRVAALLCLLAAAASALTAHRPAALTPVVVAARALTAGETLSTGDLTVRRWPASDVPATAMTDAQRAVGRRVGAPMARGEPLTRARLLNTAISDALGPGQVASTLAVNSPNSGALLQAGSVVDLYAGATTAVLADGAPVAGPATARAVADGVTVLSVLPAETATTQSGQTTLVVATSRAVAAVLASHASGIFLATLVSPR